MSYDLENILKEFITSQKAFNKTIEEKLEKLDSLVSKLDVLLVILKFWKMELLTHHPGGRHGDVEPSGIDFLSDRVPGLTSESPRIRFRYGGGFGSNSSFFSLSSPPSFQENCQREL